MKISLDFLSDFVEITEKNATTIKDVITERSAEVETMETQGEHLSKVVVGKITEVKPHPNADALRLTRVFDGKEEMQVVCGGSNLEVGQLIAFAQLGAVVRWHGGETVKMEKAKIRGEESFGMICGADEIGLDELFPKGGEKEIVDLSYLKVAPGTPLAEALGLSDTVLDIDNHAITNRSDLFSHRGFAREFVACGLAKWKKFKEPKLAEGNGKWPVELNIKDADVCSRYLGIHLTGITVGDSPDWMKKRLSACGVNPINNIVDITNYVMLELGMPLHAFDLDRVKGKKWTMRKSKKGENVTTLDGQTHELPSDAIVLDDGKEIIDLCGIMGGASSGIEPSTKEVWLIAPVYNSTFVRRGMRTLGHISDAAIIYEKGVDDELCDEGLARAVELVLELCPTAKVESKQMEVRNRAAENRTLEVKTDYIRQIIGADLTEKEMTTILETLGFDVKANKGSLEVSVPSFRLNDVKHAADVAEEIARIYGYNQIPYTTPLKDITPIAPNVRRREERAIRNRLTSFGFDEICTFAFLGPELLRKACMKADDSIELLNPISADLSLMRQSLLPRTMETIEANLRYQKSFRLFELSRVYLKKGDGHEERSTLVAAMVGGANELSSVRGIAQAMGLNILPAKESASHQHPGRNADLMVRGKKVGSLYQVHPQVLKNFDIKERVAVMEVDIEAIHEMGIEHRPKYSELPKFPAVTLDISIMIPRKNLAADYFSAIEKADKLVRRVDLIDEYTGDKVTKDKRALTFSITYLADDRTLTDGEVEAVHKQVTKQLTDKGAEIR